MKEGSQRSGTTQTTQENLNLWTSCNSTFCLRTEPLVMLTARFHGVPQVEAFGVVRIMEFLSLFVAFSGQRCLPQSRLIHTVRETTMHLNISLSSFATILSCTEIGRPCYASCLDATRRLFARRSGLDVPRIRQT